MLEYAHTDTLRRALAFDLLVAVAHRMYPPITLGFISFRSHAEAFLARQDNARQESAGRLRAEFDALYRRNAPRLTARVAEVVGCLGQGTPDLPFVADWVARLDPYRTRGGELIARGDTPMRWERIETQPAADRSWVATSPLHQLMRTSDNFIRFMNEHMPVRSFRLVLNFTYLHLARLGLTEVDRYLVCHLISNAVEERYGVSAMDRAAQVVEHGAPMASPA
jgi:hypothetical protein